MRYKKQSQFNHISESIVSASKKLNDKEFGQNLLVRLMWKDAVGEINAKNSFVLKYQNEKLYVACKNSVWANELKLLAPQILFQINKACKNIKIKEIYFSVKDYKRIDITENKIQINLEEIELSKEENDYALKLSENAGNNQELAEAIKKAFISNQKANKIKNK